MKRHVKTRLVALAAILIVCGWGGAVRAERMPVNFVHVSGERMKSAASGTDRLMISWEFTAETESFSLTEKTKDATFLTVLYEVRLLDRSGSLAAVIPGTGLEARDCEDIGTFGATIFFNEEDMLVMRENALIFSMDASDFNIVSAYGTGEITGRFMKKISGAARIEKPISYSIRRMEIIITEVFLHSPPD